MQNMSNDFEDGLKMIEELTTNAEQIQEELLGRILQRNAGTEYLSRYLNAKTNKELFKKNVPIVSYEDIKPYIDRIANGETSSNILLAEPLTEFYLSSGSTGGQPKLLPATAEVYDLRTVFVTSLASVLKKHFGDINQAGRTLDFMFARQEIETPSGLKARLVTTSAYMENGFRSILSKFYTTPIEAIFCLDTNQSMYCQLLTGLVQRDEVVIVGSPFAAALLRAIKFLEDHWNKLCYNIRTGHISDWISDSGCRKAVSSILKPNPRLAGSIENICSCKSWEGIIKKLWPKAKLIKTITTGVMSQYVETLEFYSGGLPLVSPCYGCTEALCGINLELLSGPSHVSYTFLPNMAYFEFLPIDKDSVSIYQPPSIENESNNEAVEPVDLVDVKLDQYYQLLITSSGGLYRYKVGDILKVTGFHNSSPQFQFVGRENVILSVDVDKTTEADLLKAVTDAKALLDTLGFILREYTSYVDTSSIPGHYVLFWELKPRDGNENQELDPKIMEECCHRMEEALSYIYRLLRKRNEIGALEIRVVNQGSFDELMDYYVSQRISVSQYKTPSCIKSKEAINILGRKVIEKFFSLKNPML